MKKEIDSVEYFVTYMEQMHKAVEKFEKRLDRLERIAKLNGDGVRAKEVDEL